MIHAFGRYELDEQTLELRLDGAAVELQPLVFQLLLYLLKHRDRVVAKNELLEAVWPDSMVTESSLQRAVSLARTALRKGGMQDAIKNIPRAGYRFVAELAGAPAPSDAAQLEAAADAEKWAGRLSAAVPLLENALAAYREAGDNRAAARVAIRLARIQQERMEGATAMGMLAVAGNLLRELPECREHGLHAWMQGELAVVGEDVAAGLTHCDRAYEISRRVKDADLEALAMATRGHALAASGKSAAAAGCHAEAAALVLAGGVGPEHGGYVMCSVITSAVNRGDWASASQWTEQFTRWCERFGKSSYPGLCQLHRAELMHFQGQLPRALEEVELACRVLKEAAPWAEGDAWRVLGDVHLAQGDLSAAESAYQRAHAMGWDPQPGLAWMHFARGNADSAIGSLQRALESMNWYSRERRVLYQAELVALAAEAGNLKLARETLKTLAAQDSTGLPMHEALLARANARLAAAENRYPQALSFLNEARRHWLKLGATLNAATEHLHAAKVLRAAGDNVAAELELTTTAAAFKTAGATGPHTECTRLQKQWHK